MIDLEFLGLDANGRKLTFNDADGNRYEAAITAELRGALRKDITLANSEASPEPQSTPKAASPKEIQAYFRAGMSITEVSEICSIPPLQLSKLASPILSERKFIANQARSYHKNQDSAELSINELVTSRLVSRGVDATEIEWDAIRKQDSPWVLIARYTVAENLTEAKWQVNSKAHFITPLNDEATWLTDTPIPAPSDPWRPLNIPKVTEINQAHTAVVTNSAGATDDAANLHTLQNPEQYSDTTLENTAETAIDIDKMLASLDEQRGISQPAPKYEEMPEFSGAHPAYSEPENAYDAQILHFPDKTASSSSATAPSADTADSTVSIELNETEDTAKDDTETEIETISSSQTLPGLESNIDLQKKKNESPAEKKNKNRRGRPEMPSWDEIIYGYSKD